MIAAQFIPSYASDYVAYQIQQCRKKPGISVSPWTSSPVEAMAQSCLNACKTFGNLMFSFFRELKFPTGFFIPPYNALIDIAYRYQLVIERVHYQHQVLTVLQRVLAPPLIKCTHWQHWPSTQLFQNSYH